MRILTVRQPWAAAIIHAGKDVENRVRNIAGDYRGPVAIHAGARIPPIFDVELFAHQHRGAFSDIIRGEGEEAVFGAIIGVVDLVDVHPAGREYELIGAGVSQITDRTCCGTWAMRDHYHLGLTNPRTLRTPIPYKGALGLRTLPDDVAAQITANLLTERSN
ncbi:hypothetical protein [Leifsonia sp. NPDC058248]|uniref:hypothetical protein n=1 Tax=Leifsonia sp. NPDC058248 TaxID=3346402 RepID=UPI0036D9FF95